MANPQLDNGHIKIANELFDVILKANFSKRELLLIFAVMRKTYGWNKKLDKISHSQFVEITNLDKGNVCKTTKQLIQKKVILRDSSGRIGINKNYEQWEIVKTTIGDGVVKITTKRCQNNNASCQNNNESVVKTTTTKDMIKDTIQKTLLKTRGAGAIGSVSKNQTFFNEIKNYWNVKAGNPKDTTSIPKIIALTPWRIEKLKARLKENAFVKHWKEAIDRAMASAFCCGKNDRGWKIDFSWFIENSNNYLKVLEGKYDNKQQGHSKYDQCRDDDVSDLIGGNKS